MTDRVVCVDYIVYICIRLKALIADAKEDTEMLDCTIFYTKPLQFLSKHSGDIEVATNATRTLTTKADNHATAFKYVVSPLLRMNASQFTVPSQPSKKRRISAPAE